MRRTAYLIALLSFAGCKKDAPPAKSDDLIQAPTKHEDPKAALKGTPRPQSKLTVTVDGKPVEMKTAYVIKEADGDLRFEVSSELATCDLVTSNMRQIYDSETSFNVRASALLEPDGSLTYQTASTYFSGQNDSFPKPTTLTGDGSPDKPATIDVDFETKSIMEPQKTLKVTGTIDAIGCVAPPPEHPAPPLPPEQPASITVAGKKFPVRLAKLEKRGDEVSLEISSGGTVCKGTGWEAGDELKMSFTFGKEKLDRIWMGGDLVPQASESLVDEAKRFKVTPAVPAAGEVEIAADTTVNGYPVKIEGKFTAVECPN